MSNSVSVATSSQTPASNPPRQISELARLVAALGDDDRSRINRLFQIVTSTGELEAPASMHAWIEGLFGSVAAVEAQRVIRTTNLVTYEGTLFNELRSARPMETELPDDLGAIVTSGSGDPFCRPLEGTPADTFGRVKGRYSITASNIAKYDALHGVIVFDQHNPLAFSREVIADAFDVGFRWADKAVAHDPLACYFFLMWNCMWKSGASILHGHAQVTCTRERHYARVEQLRAAAEGYRNQHGANYFEDLIRAHRSLGLTIERGAATVLASLTPIKEKEVWILADQYTDALAGVIYGVLECLTRRLGVVSFNLVAYMPPLRAVPENWDGFPFIVRIVDRGPLANKTADFGAMELYASSVVSSDPFRLIAALDSHVG
ncbi:MAG: hypothetical protein ACKVVP_06255 [Chloroflexota bacterium]